MPPRVDVITFVADRGDARCRLDQAIQRHIHDVAPRSRTRVQAWIAAGLVRVNGLPATRAAARPREGVLVEVSLPAEVTRRQPPAPEAMSLSILFEDDALLVVDKPAGLVVHPSYKQSSGTLLNAVLAHRGRGAAEPGIITRLDKHTSGLVLIAVAPDVHRTVQLDADTGRLTKEYLAIVDGTPSPRWGVIEDALARDPVDRRRMKAMAGGACATTRYEVLATHSGRSLVRCELVTGRTHQIRAHLAARGWPLVGDAVYGARDALLGTRQALHAWRVTLPHPLTRQALTFVADPPDDLRASAPQLFGALPALNLP